MAVLKGPDRLVFVDESAWSLFELPHRYGEPVAVLPQVDRNFYRDWVIGAASLVQLQDELLRLLRGRRSELEPGLVKTRKVFARDPSVRERILVGLLREDRLYAKLEELIELCEECLTRNADLRWEGD